MSLFKSWIPPELLRIARHVLGYGGHFRGNYRTWQDAEQHTQGYNAEQILQQVLAATLAVRDGKAVYERDGVTFDCPHHPYPLIATLLRAAHARNSLHVVDFGGALGSSYFQCLPWLSHLINIDWCVVEQPHFVEAGNHKVARDGLRFAPTIAAARITPPDVMLFSGVLQYLGSYEQILDEALASAPRYLVLDRTPTIAGTRDLIRIQRQSTRSLAASSYPIRLFSEASLMQIAKRSYHLLSRFDAVDAPMGGVGSKVTFRGYIFERKEA
jgi:putative methyltransferase (TIGR04325 family)